VLTPGVDGPMVAKSAPANAGIIVAPSSAPIEPGANVIAAEVDAAMVIAAAAAGAMVMAAPGAMVNAASRGVVVPWRSRAPHAVHASRSAGVVWPQAEQITGVDAHYPLQTTWIAASFCSPRQPAAGPLARNIPRNRSARWHVA